MMKKRGVSIIIGYVLLIVIAVSLSILVYAWMKNYLPKPAEECPESATLTIADYSCQNEKLNLTLQNSGLFNLDGFIVRITNKSDGLLYTLKEDGRIENFFVNETNDENPLKPNQRYTKNIGYGDYGKIVKIEIQPFIFNENILLCDKAIIAQNLEGCD